MTIQLLLIENDLSVADELTDGLEAEGIIVHLARDGHSGVLKARELLPDLCLMNLILSDIDGVQVCRMLRADFRTETIPILMLSDRDDEDDEVRCFDAGADDYVTKPFYTPSLIMRIRALLRRNASTVLRVNTLSAGGVKLDRVKGSAHYSGRNLELTLTEFRVLWILMSQPGRPFHRSKLIEADPDGAKCCERTIDVHIRSIREKLMNGQGLIETVFGIGYRFAQNAKLPLHGSSIRMN